MPKHSADSPSQGATPQPKENLVRYVVDERATIFEAMRAINDNWREVVFVQNHSGRIVGLITDGDIRRGLLRGLKFEAKVGEVMSRDFISVRRQIDRNGVMDVMKARHIRHVPVLDEEGRLIGVHFLRDLVGTKEKPNWAVIMAGGKGTRLRPLTQNCPKPMIQVAGRPILERLVYQLVGYGIRNIFISINYLGNMIEEHFGDGKNFGCSIHYLREGKELGSGGALSLLPERPEHPTLVMNGDLVTQINFNQMLDYHDSEGCSATMAVREHVVEIPFGVADIKHRRLIDMREKPVITNLINAGIYVFNPEVIDLIPADEFFPATDIFPMCHEKGMSVAVYPISDEWLDVGRKSELDKARGLI